MKKIFFIFTLILLNSCQKGIDKNYTFYYWRTKLALNKTEKENLTKAKTPFIYTRFFDIDKLEGKFVPIGIITKDSSFVTDKKIVPVVFIKNEIFYHITPEEIGFLAKNIEQLIDRKMKELKLNPANEIQIDCDWNAGTNKEYFSFLERMKEFSKRDISCTLRLHQVKDSGIMGIPPVDKAYLMCYATSSPLDDSDKNSILDVQTLKNYLKYVSSYPIHFDVALPIFSWGIVTNHLGKHKLINALTKEDLISNSDFKQEKNNFFTLQKDGFYFGMYMSKGFMIKIEEVSDQDLMETINFLDSKLFRPFSIVYYQLDSKFTKNYKNLLQ